MKKTGLILILICILTFNSGAYQVYADNVNLVYAGPSDVHYNLEKASFKITMTTSNFDKSNGRTLSNSLYKKIKNLKSSNKKIASVKKIKYADSYSVRITPKAQGTAKISFSYYHKTKKKWKKVSGTVKVIAYTENPFSRLVIGGRDLTSKCTSYSGLNVSMYYLGADTLNFSIAAKMKNGWSISNRKYYATPMRFMEAEEVSLSEFQKLNLQDYYSVSVKFTVTNKNRNIKMPVSIRVNRTPQPEYTYVNGEYYQYPM